jgi:hypothetical protein
MPTREQKLAYKKTYREKHKEQIREYRQEYKRTHKQDSRKYWVKRKYGLTSEHYDKLFNNQEGKCAICGIHQDNNGRSLSVDHDHCTGKVRGLLCYKCNTILGYCVDNINILTNAINYLKSFSQ